jgi:hypothetical protein
VGASMVSSRAVGATRRIVGGAPQGYSFQLPPTLPLVMLALNRAGALPHAG